MNVGADFFYDTSIYYHLLFMGEAYKKEYGYYGGVHIGYEPYWAIPQFLFKAVYIFITRLTYTESFTIERQ